MEPEFLHLTGGFALARVQLDVYGLQPLLKTAHRFTDRAFIHLEYERDGVVLVRFKTKRRLDSLQDIAGEFLNELLDQQLRERLSLQTEPVRRLILAQAFSRTNLLNPELDNADRMSDPLDVQTPDDARK